MRPGNFQGQASTVIARRRKVASLRLAGVNDQTQIATMLGFSNAVICRDFQIIDDEWRRQATEEINVVKGRQLKRIEAMIREIWAPMIDGKNPLSVRDKLNIIDRVADLIKLESRIVGTEAPARLDVTLTLQAVAEALGFDPSDAVAEAETIIRSARIRGEVERNE
jgi:hypothetical protein